MFDINKIIRKNIKNLTPYSSARDEFWGDASVFLDANENPFNFPYNRYPDPLQRELKLKISKIKNISPENIFLGNGSDEPIDLLIRAFCEPASENIVAIEPTYGMYKVAANINNVEYRKVLLDENYDIKAEKVLSASDKNSKLIFLCSPNNPTGNYLNEEEIKVVINNFDGIVVLDEAYIDFSSHKGFLETLINHPNLVILQTFSKAWGLASIRLGMAFAEKGIIDVLNKIKYPYNINLLTQKFVIDALDDYDKKTNWVETILNNREKLISELKTMPLIKRVFPTDANFFLIKVDDPIAVYNYLVDKKIIVRNRSNVTLCEGCLRVTVGTDEENKALINALKGFE